MSRPTLFLSCPERHHRRVLGLALTALCGLACIAHAQAPASDLDRAQLLAAVEGRVSSGCSVYERLRPGPELLAQGAQPWDDTIYATKWFWPAWLYLAAQCGSGKMDDTQPVPAVLNLYARRSAVESQRLTAFLAALLKARAGNFREARAMLGVLPTTYLKLYPYQPWLEARVTLGVADEDLTSLEARPTYLLFPVDVSSASLPDLDPREKEDISTALTWMILESAARIKATYPTEDSFRCLTVEQDLALRLKNRCLEKTITKHTTGAGETVSYQENVPESYAALEPPVALIARLLPGSRVEIKLSDSVAPDRFLWPDRTTHRTTTAASLDGAPALTVRAAVALMTDARSRSADSTSTPPWPAAEDSLLLTRRPEWLVLPPGQANLHLFAEAVGQQTRGNFEVARRRYQELLDANPSASEGELQLAKRQLLLCDGLWNFDTWNRFFRGIEKDGEIREAILRIGAR